MSRLANRAGSGDVSREDRTCRFCHSIIRRDRADGWYDIDMNHDTNPRPWLCNGRYMASPQRVHLPDRDDKPLEVD